MKLILALFPLALLAQEAKPLTRDQLNALQDIASKAQSLVKDEATADATKRAIAAERLVLQLRYEALVKDACPQDATCKLDTTSSDPVKWALIVTPKPEPPKK